MSCPNWLCLGKNTPSVVLGSFVSPPIYTCSIAEATFSNLHNCRLQAQNYKLNNLLNWISAKTPYQSRPVLCKSRSAERREDIKHLILQGTHFYSQHKPVKNQTFTAKEFSVIQDVNTAGHSFLLTAQGCKKPFTAKEFSVIQDVKPFPRMLSVHSTERMSYLWARNSWNPLGQDEVLLAAVSAARPRCSLVRTQGHLRGHQNLNAALQYTMYSPCLAWFISP